MSELNSLILSIVPEDGSSIGNGTVLARLREQLADLSDEDYASARDELVDQGVLGRGKGRGGSVYRKDVWELELSAQDVGEIEPVTRKSQKNKTKKKTNRKSDEPTKVLPYRHDEKRVNNPEVGMVHADTDPDGAKTEWQYDPHLDPALNFDGARSSIEGLIDDALASNDQ